MPMPRVAAAGLALAASAAAFAPSPALPSAAPRIAIQSRAAAAVCAEAQTPKGRRDALLRAGALAGTFVLQGPTTVFAADEDDDDEREAPGSVPRDVTFKVKDDVCEKHPTWKQCKKKAAAPVGKLNAPEVKMDNGLIVKDLVAGKGNSPKPGDACTVHYSLYYKGDEIESSRESSGLAASPIGFQFGVTEGVGSVIPAIALGVADMKVGGVRRITAPPELAFGKRGRQGGRVPPGATVDFDVQLLSVKRAGTNPITKQGSGSEAKTGFLDLF